MEEFAAVSGISRPTVSKYFNDPDSVRSSTTRADRGGAGALRLPPEHLRGEPEPQADQEYRHRRALSRRPVLRRDRPAASSAAASMRDTGRSCYSAHGGRSWKRHSRQPAVAESRRACCWRRLGRASDRLAIEKFCKDVPTVLFDSNIEGMGEAFVGSDNFSFVSQTVEYLTRTGSRPASSRCAHRPTRTPTSAGSPISR
jgi:hypothetical protein